MHDYDLQQRVCSSRTEHHNGESFRKAASEAPLLVNGPFMSYRVIFHQVYWLLIPRYSPPIGWGRRP